MKNRSDGSGAATEVWEHRFGWLRAGTIRGVAPPLGDMLRHTAGRAWHSVVRSRQVHGSGVLAHVDIVLGPSLAGEGDGHVTRVPGALLTVTVADCVPVFLADPANRAVGLLHAGWRGTAAGVVEGGVSALCETFGSRPCDMAVHLGPAICGGCYEVGPEVLRALGLGEPTPASRTRVDLRGAIVRRAAVAGIPADRVTVSPECTLCGGGGFLSHRRGDSGRQRAFIGVVAEDGRGRHATPPGGRAGGDSGGHPGRVAPGASARDHAPQVGGHTLRVGLCARCGWTRRITSRRGSTFFLCGRHRQDPAFPKYPPLPVSECRGFEPADDDRRG